MPEDSKPTELTVSPRIRKLPVWAQHQITHLTRSVNELTRKLNELEDGAPEGRAYIPGYLVDGRRGKFYLPGHQVDFDHAGVRLQVIAYGNRIKLYFDPSDQEGYRRATHRDEVMILPVASNTIQLIRATHTFENPDR